MRGGRILAVVAPQQGQRHSRPRQKLVGRVSRYLGSEPYHLLAGGGLKYLDWARGGSRNFVLLDVALKANIYTIARMRGVVARDGTCLCGTSG